MKKTQELEVNVFAKRNATLEDRNYLTELYGECSNPAGYQSVKCPFDNPVFTAIFVECEDEKVSLSVEEGIEAIEAVYDLLPARVVKSIKERLALGTVKPYARKEGYSKDGQVLSHGIVFTTQTSSMRVTITR